MNPKLGVFLNNNKKKCPSLITLMHFKARPGTPGKKEIKIRVPRADWNTLRLLECNAQAWDKQSKRQRREGDLALLFLKCQLEGLELRG